MKTSLVISFALLLGCSSPGGPEGGSDAELILGGSEIDGSGYLELVDGEDVELVAGSQAGFHVYLNLDLFGVDGRVQVQREARRVADDALVLRTTPMSVDVPAEAMIDNWKMPFGIPSFMCPTPVGIQVHDEEIEFRAVLMSEDGEILTDDSLTLIPRCPSGELEDFCLDICSG